MTFHSTARRRPSPFPAGSPAISSMLACFAVLCGGTSLGEIVHQWRFEETSGVVLADSVGSADAAIVTLPGGGGHALGGGALTLGGGGRDGADYVEFPEETFDGLEDVTIEVWAAPHSFPSWGRVFCVGPGDGAELLEGQNLLRVAFSRESDGDLQRAGVWGLPSIDSELPTAVGREYHYVLTWSADGAGPDNGLIRMYRDGVLLGTQETGSTDIATLAALENTSFWLGRTHFPADETANASWSELRVHDRALDETEILRSAVAGPDGAGASGADGLEHRWSFDGTLEDDVGDRDAELVDPDSDDETGGSGDLTSNPGSVRLMGGDRESSAYVSLGGGLLAGRSQPVTLELWATPHRHLNWSRIFDFGSGQDESLFMSWTRAAEPDEDRVGWIDEGGPESRADDTNAPYELGTEQHIALVIEPGAGGGGETRVTWYSGPASDTADLSPRGVLETDFTLADLNDTSAWLGRSQWPDDTADAAYNEFRVYGRALSAAQLRLNRIAGPDSLEIAAPVASADSTRLRPGHAVSIEVLENDAGTAIDPASVVIEEPPVYGTANPRPDGSVLYAHGGGDVLPDTFRYSVANHFGDRSEPVEVAVDVTEDLRLAAEDMTMPADPPPLAIGTVDAFPGLTFDDALCIRHAPGEPNSLFVGERRGRIAYVPDIHAENPERRVMLDISSRTAFDDTNEGELGLLSFEFHPDFQNNGYVYVFYTAPGGVPYFDRLSRFTIQIDGEDGLEMVPDSELVLIEQPDEVFNHNAGDIHFGPDGYLYISMGDEGNQMNARDNAQRITKDLFSGILRIDVDKRAGNLEPNPHEAIPTDDGAARFSIPADNPFIHTSLGGDWDGTFNGSEISELSQVRTEFWAVGLRSPWRMSFDAETGELWVGDVGQDTWEEVTIVGRGENHGWAWREGFQQTPGTPTANIGTPPEEFSGTDPVWDYHHPAGGYDPNFTGRSVTGGVSYYGSGIPELEGAYVFADFRSGNLWALRRDGEVTVERIAGDAGIAAFGTDPVNGDVLMADYTENRIKRLVVSDAGGSEFPETLAETGLFADVGTLSPAPGVVPYEPNVAFWSDHATKSRWFALPDLESGIGYSRDGNWDLPPGMVWVKHFDMEMTRGDPSSRRRVETRVLVRNDDGSYGVSYRWNDEQDEARLVPESGELFDLEIEVDGAPTTQTYEIPSRSDCMRCHTEVGGHALSFHTRQLHREAELLGIGGNQIETLHAAGYLESPPHGLDSIAPFAEAGDAATNLEFRVRSYLAVNCAQCHQPDGPAPSNWDARAHLTLEETGLINGAVERDQADPLNRLVVPGDTAHSVLLQRIQGGNGFTRMPPLGSHALDEADIDLVTQWITAELPNRRLYDDWAADFQDLGGRDADPDGDGRDNYAEFVAGTRPDVSDEVPGPSISAGSEGMELEFAHPAHRGVIIETSDDLAEWSLWEHPENRLRYPSAESEESFAIPEGAGTGFFRLRMNEQ